MAAAADWSSLPPDLIRRVGDCLLADSDVDRYMDMRAVCRGWRFATDDPCRCDAAGANFLRFCPRKWVMLEEEPNGGDGEDYDTRLFLNVCTGRFLRLRVPALRDHFLVGASDGLIVLAGRERPHAARLLNPLTGSLLRFAAPIPSGTVVMRAAVSGSDNSPSLVFSFHHGHYYCDAASFAAPATRELMPVQLIHPAAAPGQVLLPSMATHAGHVYMATRDGSAAVSKVVVIGPSESPPQHCHAELVTAQTPPPASKARHGQTFLVVSAGELLLVRRLRQGRAEVLRVEDVDERTKVVAHAPAVRDIGRRALFLGDRCLSVDADNLPAAVGANCVYYIGMNGNGIFECDLMAGREKRICSPRVRPFSLVQVLLNHCMVLPDAKAQLRRIYRTCFLVLENVVNSLPVNLALIAALSILLYLIV